jgi:hypothetical protein
MRLNSSSDNGSNFSSSYCDAPASIDSVQSVLDGERDSMFSIRVCFGLGSATNGLLRFLEVLLSVSFPRDKCH